MVLEKHCKCGAVDCEVAIVFGVLSLGYRE